MGAGDEGRDGIFHKDYGTIKLFNIVLDLDSLAHLRQGLRQKRRSGNYSQFRQDKTASYPIQSKRQ